MKKKEVTESNNEEKLTVLQICNVLKITGNSRQVITEKHPNSFMTEKEWIETLKKFGII